MNQWHKMASLIIGKTKFGTNQKHKKMQDKLEFQTLLRECMNYSCLLLDCRFFGFKKNSRFN